MINTTSPTSDATRLAELIKDSRVAMLITAATPGNPERRLHARPMYAQDVKPETFDGTLWFFTDTESAKVHEISADNRVILCYCDPGKNRYVAVSGEATVDHDPVKARELWSIHAKGWWPEGPESPRLSLLRVTVHSAEFWDGPSNAAYMLHLAKAVATGQRIQPGGEHAKVRFSDSQG